MTKSFDRASHHVSPLRYPGGKSKLTPFIKTIMRCNHLLDTTYVEPFAGGGGVGLSLLLHGYVNQIVLNDLNKAIYAFWTAILEETERFCQAILEVELTIEEWARQRAIFRNADEADRFSFGFSAFYLNRTNRSGVLNGGMIGGYAQVSSYGLTARFNRTDLVARIKRVARHRSQITVLNMDAADLLLNIEGNVGQSPMLLYIDPPYYKKGRDLYYDFFQHDDHLKLSTIVALVQPNAKWIVSYDDQEPIRNLYRDYRFVEYDLSYSVKNGMVGKEIMFFSNSLIVPEGIRNSLQRRENVVSCLTT